ncbi:uncharacterized protein JCM10292_007745 [Rhodotorula paludigena]|uniref:uncharacterized protein n=1 Tax=Rhodotorula paludigena TaxID=86838 RepID=UPI0031819DB0
MAARTSLWQRHRFLTALAAFSVPATAAAHVYLSRLEQRVKLLNPPEDSPLRVPRGGKSQRVHDIEHWTVAVPLARLVAAQHALEKRCPAHEPQMAASTVLQRLGADATSTTRQPSRLKPDPTALTLAWTRLFLTSPPMTLQARVFGGFSPALGTGYSGATGFHPGQSLLNGLFHVVRVPAPEPVAPSSDELLAQFDMPPDLVRFFERVARWGYPWRLMSGGRHTWQASLLQTAEESEPLVELRFGCAHDYARTGGRDGREDGKIMPPLVNWAHRVYARVLVDQAAKRIERLAQEHEQEQGRLRGAHKA